jgi:hypothetical protein
MSQKYSMTFESLCTLAAAPKDEILNLIAVSIDELAFRDSISRRYDVTLTPKQVAEVYETAPLSD